MALSLPGYYGGAGAPAPAPVNHAAVIIALQSATAEVHRLTDAINIMWRQLQTLATAGQVEAVQQQLSDIGIQLTSSAEAAAAK